MYGIRSRSRGDTVNGLKDLEIKNLKLPEKPKKLYDSGGLYLYLTPNGLKSWRHEYAFQGKRSTLTFGTYPDISLKVAREKLVEAKLREGIDPGSQKKTILTSQEAEKQDTFEAVSREWFETKKSGIKE
ncbi:MAG: Arm DNA-binding domain-containing protein, partial [Deltaproteobacteria bacterium]|nr:Arm DNA-binding domain-containing protein [Deltaproteobacteria bacterium]